MTTFALGFSLFFLTQNSFLKTLVSYLYYRSISNSKFNEKNAKLIYENFKMNRDLRSANSNPARSVLLTTFSLQLYYDVSWYETGFQ